jgi:hypothetical protein
MLEPAWILCRGLGTEFLIHPGSRAAVGGSVTLRPLFRCIVDIDSEKRTSWLERRLIPKVIDIDPFHRSGLGADFCRQSRARRACAGHFKRRATPLAPKKRPAKAFDNKGPIQGLSDACRDWVSATNSGGRRRTKLYSMRTSNLLRATSGYHPASDILARGRECLEVKKGALRAMKFTGVGQVEIWRFSAPSRDSSLARTGRGLPSQMAPRR